MNQKNRTCTCTSGTTLCS